MAIKPNNFSSSVSSVTLSQLSGGQDIKHIVNGQLTGETLTGTSQLLTSGTSASWGSFVETSGTDVYHVYFFFSASSVNAASSTYEDVHITGEDSAFSGASLINTIYRINEGGSDTDYYAIEMTFNERYESQAFNERYESIYVSAVHLVTEDPETFLNTTIQATHTYCQASA